jgi:hypothetical protein
MNSMNYHMQANIEMHRMTDVRLMAEKRTTMSLSEKTRDRLSKFGFAGESLETALNRLMDQVEKERRKKEN